MNSGAVRRIIFNFADKCNMACPYCYVPFRGGEVSEALCRQVVERIAQVGFNVVTFGGGDPFQYAFFPALAEHAKCNHLVVHVDTNAVGIKPNLLCAKFVANTIDLLGLPLDGSRAEIHAAMRAAGLGHFRQVVRTIEGAVTAGAKVKINTVVARPNLRDLALMLPMVATLSVARWSLYQYWPLDAGAFAQDRYSITSEQFSSAINPITAAAQAPGMPVIEANGLHDRRFNYPFVSQTGHLYVHKADDASSYHMLGSIFEDGPTEEALSVSAGERAQAKSRYHLL